MANLTTTLMENFLTERADEPSWIDALWDFERKLAEYLRGSTDSKYAKKMRRKPKIGRAGRGKGASLEYTFDDGKITFTASVVSDKDKIRLAYSGNHPGLKRRTVKSAYKGPFEVDITEPWKLKGKMNGLLGAALVDDEGKSQLR